MATVLRQDVTIPAGPPLKRKIAAILAADVAGYSRLVAEAEERTLHELAAVREVFDAFVDGAGGRIFNTAGDSVMCEFDSAVEAVRAAIDIQESLRGRNAQVEPDRRLEFRIGITIGDVVERGGDLLGDGVNIAARLESLSPPGGICVSRSVHEAVANKISARFRDIGARQVKNLPQPVHAYVISPPGGELVVEPVVPTGRVRASAGVLEDLARPAGRKRWIAPLVVIALIFLGIPALKAVRRAIDDWQPQSGLMSEKPAGPETAPAEQKPPEGRMAEAPANPAVKPPVAPPKTPPAKPPVRNVETTPEKPAGKPSEKPPERAAERPALPADSAAAFAALAAQGVVPDAKTLAELYHNARVEETKGDKAAALASFRQAAPLAGEAVDPLLRYAALVRSSEGAAAARRVFGELSRSHPSKAVSLVSILSSEGDERTAKLAEFAAANADFYPADYLRAESLVAGRASSTLTERRLAYDAFDRFLDAGSDRRLAPYFVDRAFLDAWIEGARKRRGEIEAFFAGAKTRPSATFARSDSGWLATLSLPEPATSVAVRVGDRGEFEATGATRGGDPQGGKAAPSLEVSLPAATGRTTLYVTYKDSSGREAGPFPLPFDPMTALVAQERESLERFPNSWVSFRPDLPDLLSYAQLASNRCAIKDAEIGFNDDVPRQALALPPCDAASPSALPSDSRSLLTLPPDVDHVQVKLTYADGTESQVRTFRRP